VNWARARRRRHDDVARITARRAFHFIPAIPARVQRRVQEAIATNSSRNAGANRTLLATSLTLVRDLV
jgi:hypothetical protein